MPDDIVARLEAALDQMTNAGGGGGSAEMQRALMADALAEIDRLRRQSLGFYEQGLIPQGGAGSNVKAYLSPVRSKADH